MRPLKRLAIALGLLLAGLPAFAADPPPPSIDKLVEQLGSPSFPARERASKQLRERGPVVLPALRKALESKDEEVRKRAESLIPAMEIDEALLPKRVTLAKGADSSIKFLQDISKQTGYKVELQGTAVGGLGTPIALTDVPFWDAIEQVGKASGTIPSYESYQKMIYMRPAAGRSPFVNVRGPFRLEATWFHEDRDVDLTQAKSGTDGWRNSKLTMAVNVLAEPRLTFLKVHPAKVEEALDADGKSLLEPEDATRTAALQRSARGTFRGESLISSDVRIRRASETAKTVKVLRGTIPVQTILIRKPVVVTSKVLESGGTTFRAGNDSILIKQVTNQGGANIWVEMQVPRFENDPYRQWNERFHLEDDAGNKFNMNGGGSSSNGREFTISLYFSPPFNNKKVGAPAKLVFEDWVVHDHAIPFEFRDVPLP